MKRFVFKLEALLGVKNQRLKRAQEAFGLQLGLVAKARKTLLEQLDRRESLDNERRSMRAGEIDLAQLQAQADFTFWLEKAIAQSRKHLATLEEELEKRRQEMIAADREVKSLENIRKRQYQAHQKERRQEEQKHLDHVAGARHRQGGQG
jgi:flagellar FliJ protein